MRLYNNTNSENYELVYSTRNTIRAGSRDGNAGDESGKTKKNGSRRGGAGGTGKTQSNPSRRRGYFEEDKPENHSPSDIIKKKQQERKKDVLK